MEECNNSPRRRKKPFLLLSDDQVGKAAEGSPVERDGQSSSSSSSSELHHRRKWRPSSFIAYWCRETLRLQFVAMIVLVAVLLFFYHSLQSQEWSDWWLRAFSSVIATNSGVPPGAPLSVFPDWSSEPYYYSPTSNLESGFYKGLQPVRLILKPDYGDLELVSLRMLPETEFHRDINGHDDQAYNNQRSLLLHAIDDPKMNPKLYSFEDRDFEPGGCIPPKWQYDSHPNCNTFHELSMDLPPEQQEQQFHVKYLGSGHYRQSYLFHPLKNQPNKSTTAIASKIVLKHLHYSDLFDFTQYDMKKVHTEVLVMEILSGSPRTSNIYGWCSTSTIVQYGREITNDVVPLWGDWQEAAGRISQRQLDQLEKEDVYPMNNFTAHEKLKMALIMAEALAEMHGHVGGVIVHDDVRVNQWLITDDDDDNDDGRLVLNDMNSAVILDWNFENKTYCKYQKNYGGRLRAPESYSRRRVRDESVDIWTVGNLIFSLLTGLWPYYAHKDTEMIQQMTRKGIPPYINPKYRTRSMIEGRLVEIMNRCHKLRPEERVDIFEVVQYLRETLRIHEEDVSAGD